MEYKEAINSCMKGNKIRSTLMDKGEYIKYCENEKRFLWWDQNHSGHWSYPQDIDDGDYINWILNKWEICNEIEPVKNESQHH